ncbi:protein kinase domain-containing protein [Nocardioides lijunqiniae]|uniref:protein kinase domain-containing protein n=1 Tax=Nocardioides lijunqiniae TaxID=2760832 RepID=UPI0018781FDA
MTSGDDGDSAWRPPARDTHPVEQLDGYDDLVEVGRGGDSIVYRARQVAINRQVAIKVLLINDPKRAARFAREVEITVELGRQHPNIVTVLAVGTTASGRPAIVMDYHEGGTLHDRLKSLGTLPVEEVARIGAVLADALSFAHDRGVLHRDVKPQNVLVLPTSWVLADFGIARLADSEHTSSAETFTYRHAAPQILDGLPPTAADDIWSLGSTLYTLLDSRPPFASEDPDEDSALAYLRRARTEPHRPLTAPGTQAIAPIIDRCLAKEVADRWPSAAELRDAFLGLRASAWEPGATTAGPTSPTVPTLSPSAATPLAPAPVPPRETTPRPSPEPDVVEASPVALSAVAHAPVPRDAEPTGTGLPDDHTGEDPRTAPERPEAPEDPDQPGTGRRRRVLLILGAAALVVGLTLGIVGAVLRGGDDPDQGDTTAGSTDRIPVLQSPPTATETFRDRPSKDLAVVFSLLEYDGVNLVAEWTDPAEGTGRFVLHQTLPDTGEYLELGTGTTEWKAPFAAPTGRSCYYITVHSVEGAYGISGRRCINNPL